MSRNHPGRGKAGRKFITDELFLKLSKPAPPATQPAPQNAQQPAAKPEAMQHDPRCLVMRRPDLLKLGLAVCTCWEYRQPVDKN
jgi:hypothetical protein